MQQMTEERVRVAGTTWGDADDRGESVSGGHLWKSNTHYTLPHLYAHAFM